MSKASSHTRVSSALTGRRKALFAFVALVLSTLACVLVGEVAIRIWRGELASLEPVGWAREAFAPRAVYHETLGYTPKPGRHERNFVAIVDDRGLRTNGQPRPESGALILAAGDSFTFGDDVGDDATWPAHLERALERPVVNGGVFGYGLDQSVLRAEVLIDELSPSVLVLSFIPDDIDRAAMAYRYAWKPYFRVGDAGLELMNTPVPEAPPPVRFARLRDVLRYSRLADAIFGRTARNWWMIDGEVQPSGEDGTEVGVLLMQRLARKAARAEGQGGPRVLVVAQPGARFEVGGALAVLAAARSAGLETLDLVTALSRAVESGALGIDDLFQGTEGGRFDGHMTEAGNAWVAERIAEKLVSLEW